MIILKMKINCIEKFLVVSGPLPGSVIGTAAKALSTYHVRYTPYSINNRMVVRDIT